MVWLEDVVTISAAEFWGWLLETRRATYGELQMTQRGNRFQR